MSTFCPKQLHVLKSKINARLVAVSKTHDADTILQAYTAGQCDFGENYLQEALPKINALSGKAPSIIWHYLGAIQRNKTQDIARNFDWVQTLERAIIAKRLNDARAGMAPLNVLIQINVDNEPQKSGIHPDEALTLAHEVHACPNLRLRGLMLIPKKDSLDAFAKTAALFEHMRQTIATSQFDTLSMGMSDDYQDALMHKATMVRIGTAIFGAR